MSPPVIEPVDMEVQIEDESNKLTVEPGETLLEAALQAGLNAPYSPDFDGLYELLIL